MRSKGAFKGNETGMLIVDRSSNGCRHQKMQLSGEDLNDYCRNRGLCNRCVKVVTHKRIVKLFGKNVKWEPLTIRRPNTEKAYLMDRDSTIRSSDTEYDVYKGYCLKEHTCYTMAEAKRLLGEWKEATASHNNSNNNNINNNSSSNNGGGKFRVSLAKSMLQRPGKRRTRTNPETGSVSGSVVSFASNLSGFSGGSQATTATRSSLLSGISGLSGRSGSSLSSFRKRFRGIGGGKAGSSSSSKSSPRTNNRKATNRNSSGASWSNPIGRSKTNHSSGGSIDDDDITMDELDFSARTAPGALVHLAGANGHYSSTSTNPMPVVSPIVAHRVEQLISYDYFVVLYLCKADLSSATGAANIDAIVHALRKATTLESITLERCNLDDEGIEKLAGGLEAGGHIFRDDKTKKYEALSNDDESIEFTTLKAGSNRSLKTKAFGSSSSSQQQQQQQQPQPPPSGGMLKTLKLRGNRIGNRGVQALEFLFRSSSTLEELDLSDNCIGSKGAASVLESLGQNQQGIPLKTLNLSQNEIWDLSGSVTNGSDREKPRSNRSILDTHHWTKSFLHTNSTLLELNLDGNFLHCEGTEYIAEALFWNKQNCVLHNLHLGYNGIGDNGTIALAKSLESNSTIRVLGLAENDITNTGARALLSALAVNVSMNEISGLYHNRIDRKFIIVAIKRLLHRKFDRDDVAMGTEGSSTTSSTGAPVSSKTLDTSDRSIIVESILNAEGEETSTTASSSSSHEDITAQLIDEPQEPPKQASTTTLMSSVGNSSSGSIALEAIENWDWGTFGIDEIERRNSEDNDMRIDAFMKDIAEELSQDGCDDPLVLEESIRSVTYKSNGTVKSVATMSASLSADTPLDRLVVFQAAPLAYFDRKSMQHHGVPLLNFSQEADALKDMFARDDFASDDNNGTVQVVFETATQDNFHNFFTKSWSPILHFSCYGSSNCVALENGFGYMQALSPDAMKKLVASATGGGGSSLEVVVVSSCHAEHLAEVFLNAGIPRVVCLPRDSNSFNDEGPIHFARGFYTALQQSKSLREAFAIGMEECQRKAASPRQQQLVKSYKLLPEGINHDVEIFFQNQPPPMVRTVIPTDVVQDEDPMALLPQMPDHFCGREVDVYEILESLRVDDVIRIGGVKGSGKKSVLSVLSRYILERSKSFQIDSVFWLPPPSGVIPEPDSLYGDLCLVLQWIIAAEDDIWDDTDYMEARERIIVEMEGRNSILVIDGRVFTNEIAGELLERFLTLLLNEVNVKIILITASDASRAKTKRSTSEETTIYLGPLDFRSTVKLYGNACSLISSSENGGGSMSLEEFESYLVHDSQKLEEGTPDSLVKNSKKPILSQRQKELYESMGSGNPQEILRKATSCTPGSLSNLLKIAQRPDVFVSTSRELEEQQKRWTAEMDHAIESKYYIRANDIGKTLEELKELKKVYPSLDALRAKEADLKKEFTVLLKEKRYEDANFVKRKILTLKRTMLKEKFSITPSKDGRRTDALETINEIQERMKNMMALAETLNNSATSFSERGDCIESEATFTVSENCFLEISCGKLASFWKESLSTESNSAMIVWTNEACDLETIMQQVLGDVVQEKVSSIDMLSSTEWGPAKCATGDSIAVDANSDGYIVLAVPPLPTKHTLIQKNTSLQDKDSMRYTETRLGSAIRSSFRKIQQNFNSFEEGNGEELQIGISTTLADNAFRDDIDEKDQKYLYQNLIVTLNTIVEELRRVNNGGRPTMKIIVRLFSSSGSTEALEMIRIASELGLSIANSAN